MVKYIYSILTIILVLNSCVGLKTLQKEASETEITETAGTELVLMEDIPAERAHPEPPVNIMGEGKVSAENLALFLVHNNPGIDMEFALEFAHFYIEEAYFEGVNHDIAFVQMCHETGFLAFGNLVTPDQNNFAGLGATGLPDQDGKPEKGLYFPDVRTGVRAHVQHLKAYASAEDLNNELVNPRRRFVRLGSSPTIDGLAGTWATDRQYADKLKAMLERLYMLAAE